MNTNALAKDRVPPKVSQDEVQEHWEYLWSLRPETKEERVNRILRRVFEIMREADKRSKD